MHTFLKPNISLLSAAVGFAVIAIPHFALAVDYQPLTAIPGIDQSGGSGLADYINALFLLSIAVGGLLAVLKIAIGGFQYMTSGDNASSRESARKGIFGALLGLGILLSAVIILTTINKDLVNLNILRNASGTKSGPPSTETLDTTPLIKDCSEDQVFIKGVDGNNRCGEPGEQNVIPTPTAEDEFDAAEQCRYLTGGRGQYKDGECLTYSGTELKLKGTVEQQKLECGSFLGTGFRWNAEFEKCLRN